MNPQIKILNRKEKKEIEKKTEKQFGIKSLPYLLFQTNKGKIRGYSGNLSREEIQTLLKTVNIEINGIYLFNLEQDGQLRISHDAVSLFKDKITKNIIEINEEQADKFLHGEDIYIDDQETKSIVVLKFQDNLVGSGKLSQGRITNFVPKERRLKN